MILEIYTCGHLSSTYNGPLMMDLCDNKHTQMWEVALVPTSSQFIKERQLLIKADGSKHKRKYKKWHCIARH